MAGRGDRAGVRGPLPGDEAVSGRKTVGLEHVLGGYPAIQKMGIGTEAIKFSRDVFGVELAPFQKRWIRGTFRPEVNMPVLSVGRNMAARWMVSRQRRGWLSMADVLRLNDDRRRRPRP